MAGRSLDRRNIIEIPESHASFALTSAYQVPANKYADIELDSSSTFWAGGGEYSGTVLTANMGRLNGFIKYTLKNDFYDPIGITGGNNNPSRFKIQTDPQGKAKIRVKAGDTVQVSYLPVVEQAEAITISMNELFATTDPTIDANFFSIPGIDLTTPYRFYNLTHYGLVTYDQSTSLITFSHGVGGSTLGAGDPRIFMTYWQPVITVNNVNVGPLGNTLHVIGWAAGRQNPGDSATHSGRINAGAWTQTFAAFIRNNSTYNANRVTLYDLPKNNLLTKDIEGN